MFNWNGLAVRQEVTHVIKGKKLYPVEDLTKEEKDRLKEKQELLLNVKNNWDKFFDAIS